MGVESPKEEVLLAQAVLSNARDFLNVGLTILFSPNATCPETKVATISIQSAIELLAKYKLIRELGISSIVQGRVPDGPIEVALREGKLRTIGYGACLKKIENREGFSKAERDLAHKLQELRNSLIHLTADVDVEDVRTHAAWMLVRALGMFAAGEERDYGGFQNHCRFLDGANFKALTNYGAYREEAVDSATENFDTEQVFRCWECGVDAMSLRLSSTYFCYCCGLTVLADAVAYADCSLCESPHGVCYDPYNSTNGLHHGKCLHCDKTLMVWRCCRCGATHCLLGGPPPTNCKQCSSFEAGRGSCTRD
jgi:hypothetical protein